jgi:hypothetical protein
LLVRQVLYHFSSFAFRVFFWQYWGLNSKPARQMLYTQATLPAFFALVIFRSGPSLALNLDPPCIHFLISPDYRYAVLGFDYRQSVVLMTSGLVWRLWYPR